MKLVSLISALSVLFIYGNASAQSQAEICIKDIPGLFFDAVINACGEAITQDPSNALLYYNRGHAWFNKREFDRAIADYSVVIRLNPENSSAYYNRGRSWFSKKEYEKAISDYSEVIRLDPDDRYIHDERGKAWLNYQNFDRAIADFGEAIRRNPQNEKAKINLNIALDAKKLGQLKPASEPRASNLSSQLSNRIPMTQIGGTFTVPVRLNDQITLDFIVDSGASVVSVPTDVVLTLIRTRTITEKDFRGEQTYVLADGSRVKSKNFILRKLTVGNQTIINVEATIADVKGSLLLGQSFLNRLNSWSIDNKVKEFVIK